MGIKKNMLNAKLRLETIKAELEDAFGEHAKVKYCGRRFKVTAEAEFNNADNKVTAEVISHSLVPLLTTADEDFECEADMFVNRLVDETKKKIQSAAASRVLDDVFWKW